MTTRSRRVVALGVLVAILGCIGGIVSALPRSLAYVRAHPHAAKAVRAWFMGASFRDDGGVVLQQRTYDCGAAALKMVLSSRGIESDLEQLLRETRTTPAGASMLDLRLAAERYGLAVRAWSLAPADLQRAPMPVIAFVNNNHYVVVRGVSEPGVLVVDDPALGRLEWPVRRFNRHWKGETLVFDRGWTPLPTQERI